MKVLIIEDEPLAASRLKNLATKISPEIEVVGMVDSVKGSVKWFKEHELPHLIFMDIQLGDGLSFEIFEQISIQSPIVFTTAYDEYAIKAFKVNSIDYLLKPINEDDLRGALDKFETLKATKGMAQSALERIGTAVQMLTKKYKERFVTKVGDHLKFIDVSDIQYFMSEDKITFAKTKDARNHILDFTMDEVEQLVDPTRFFRINRKYIVCVEAILDMISHTNSRLKIILRSSDDSDVIVARERVQEFKSWLDR